MKVAVLTFGSRGDVQPFVAYALGLQRAGHDVFLGAPRNFAALAAEYGIPFRPMSFDTRQLMERPEVKRAVEAGDLLRFFRLKNWRFVMSVECLDTWNMTEDAEAMVFKIGAPPAAYSIARKRNIPGIEVSYLPLEPSREIPPLGGGGGKRRGPAYNRLMSELTCRLFWRIYTPAANYFRCNFLDMPPLPRSGPLREYRRIGQPTLYAFSPTVVPKPSDWRPDAHVVGNLYLDEPPGWQPPPHLCRFLETGPKPVFVSFGSMPTANPREKELAILEALRRTGSRAILQGVWGGLGNGVELTENFFSAGPVPYSWLLPRVAMIVHHGGAGTTGDALRAGIPSIVIPHAFEQPYWARRAWELGVCPGPIPLKHLSAERLAAAIHAVMADCAMQERAAALGAKIRTENGVRRAVELFEEYVRRFRENPSAATVPP